MERPAVGTLEATVLATGNRCLGRAGVHVHAHTKKGANLTEIATWLYHPEETGG